MMMEQHMIDYVKRFDRRLVSPIWGGEKAFPFLCLGHLDMARSLGFETRQVTPVLQVVKEGQLETKEELDRLIARRRIDYSYCENEIRMLHRMQEETPDRPGGGGCFGPLTVVSDILGAERMLKMSVKNPEFVELFSAYVTEFIIELAVWEKEEGDDFFWIAEPLASLVSPENFWRFSGQFLQKIYQAAGVPGFLHVCGKTIKQTPYMVRTGAEVLSIDYCTDIGACIRMVDENVVIMGNVSPSVLRFGTREDVKKEVRAILEACEGFPNFVLSTGCSIMDGTPDENMNVMFELCR